MCRMLGISANQQVNCNFLLDSFQPLSAKHPNGWGFAYRLHDSWGIKKEPRKMSKDDTYELMDKSSNIIIGHLRKASRGLHTIANTHPFHIGDWVFAHNGTIKDMDSLKAVPRGKYIPSGETDSELLFCIFLNFLELEYTPVQALEQLIAIAVRTDGIANILLSDGETLFAVGDNTELDKKLFFTRSNSGNESNLGHNTVIVASQPLTDDRWDRIEGIHCFRNGEQLR